MLSPQDWQRLIDHGIVESNKLTPPQREAVMESLDPEDVDLLIDIQEKLQDSNLTPTIAERIIGPAAGFPQ